MWQRQAGWPQRKPRKQQNETGMVAQFANCQDHQRRGNEKGKDLHEMYKKG